MVQYIGHLLLALITLAFAPDLQASNLLAAATLARGTARETRIGAPRRRLEIQPVHDT
jgi:hypothetical protein